MDVDKDAVTSPPLTVIEVRVISLRNEGFTKALSFSRN